MSDPVSNIEIEDVLSSIRRLVSEETGSQPRPEPVRQPPKENRLVLTPSLRVQVEPEEPLTSDNDGKEVEMDQQSEDEAPWNNPYATLYATAQIEPEANTESQDETELSPELQHGLAEEPVSPDQEAEDMPDVPVDDPETLEDTAGGPYVFVMKNHDEHRIDTDPLPATELDMAEDVAVVAPNEPVELGETLHDDLHVSSEPDHDEEALSKDVGLDDLMPLSAKIAALETAIGEKQDQWEPDGATGDDYAGTPVRTLHWRDQEAEAPDSDVSNKQSEATVQEISKVDEQRFDTDGDQDSDLQDNDLQGNDLDILVGDDSIMDEESLRELVAEIVHKELQGALGERITRKVRKLVRHEIHRALTTQQLD